MIGSGVMNVTEGLFMMRWVFRKVTPVIRRVHRECLEQRQTELGLGESKVSCHSVKKTGWETQSDFG